MRPISLLSFQGNLQKHTEIEFLAFGVEADVELGEWSLPQLLVRFRPVDREAKRFFFLGLENDFRLSRLDCPMRSRS